MWVTLETLVRYLCYLIILLCGWLISYRMMIPFFKRNRQPSRYPVAIQTEESMSKKSKLIRHLEMLLSITFQSRTSFALMTFFMISGSLFILALLFCYKAGQSFLTTLVITVFLALLPYLILRIWLRNIQVNSSYEADVLVTELIGQYKMNYFNMVEAIDQTIVRMKQDLYTRKALFRLSLGVKEAKNEEELDECIHEFSFSIGTQWAAMLSNNLYIAIHNRDDVKEGLEDILEELRDLKSVTEKDKQNNAESFMIIKYLVPLLYAGSVYAVFHFFGFTASKFMEYQFRNKMGLQYFVLTLVATVINYVVYYFVRKPKNDF